MLNWLCPDWGRLEGGQLLQKRDIRPALVANGVVMRRCWSPKANQRGNSMFDDWGKTRPTAEATRPVQAEATSPAPIASTFQLDATAKTERGLSARAEQNHKPTNNKSWLIMAQGDNLWTSLQETYIQHNMERFNQTAANDT